MTDNNTYVEFVRFEATGLDEVTARTKAYASIVDDLERRQQFLANSLKSPQYAGYANQVSKLTQNAERLNATLRNQAFARSAGGGIQKHTTDMTALNRQYDLMKARVGNQVLKQDVESGEYEKHAKAMQNVNRQRQLMTDTAELNVFQSDIKSGVFQQHAAALDHIARQRQKLAATAKNQIFAADIKSGALTKHASDMSAINKQYQQLQKAANLQQLVADHGRWGAAIAASSKHLQTLKTSAAIGLGAVSAFGIGLARSGLQGTVEGYRLEQSWARLSRQLAAVALPAVEKITRAIGSVAAWFERLSGSQQNNIMKLGLFAAGILTVAGALRTLTVVGTAAMGVMRAIGATGAASAVMSAAGTTAAASAVGGGAAGAAGIAGAAGAAGAAGLAARAGGGAASRFGLARMAPLLRFAGPIGATAAIAHSVTSSPYYDQLRKEGNNKLVSTLGAFGGVGMDSFSQPLKWMGLINKDYEQAYRERKGIVEPTAERRRDVTPMGVGFDELGGSWFKLQEETLKQTLARADDVAAREAAAAATRSADNLGELVRLVREQIQAAGRGGWPTP